MASRWCRSPGDKRPISATGGNADSPALRESGGKGVVNYDTVERRERACENDDAGTAINPW